MGRRKMYAVYIRRHRRRKTKNRIMTTPCTGGCKGDVDYVAGQPSTQQTLAHLFSHNTIHFHTQLSLSHITLTPTHHSNSHTSPHTHTSLSPPHITLTPTHPLTPIHHPHSHTSPSLPHIPSHPYITLTSTQLSPIICHWIRLTVAFFE